MDTITISADLSTPSGIKRVKEVSVQIGLLVLATGLEVNGAFEKTPIEKELQTIQLNIVATLALTHHFSQKMVE